MTEKLNKKNCLYVTVLELPSANKAIKTFCIIFGADEEI